MSQTEELDDVQVRLPLFNENDVQILKLIGSGSYGVVSDYIHKFVSVGLFFKCIYIYIFLD